jgi:hypothetical protein
MGKTSGFLHVETTGAFTAKEASVTTGVFETQREAMNVHGKLQYVSAVKS